MAPGNTSQSSDKPLSGLSLYAGISLSGQSPDANTTQSAQGDSAAAGTAAGAAANPSTSSGSSSTSKASTAAGSSGWSAALRFAPRKSGSSSSAGNKSKAKNRLPVAAASFAQSAAAPDDQSIAPQDTKHAATPNQKSAPAVVRDVHGNPVGISRTASSSSLASMAAMPSSDTAITHTQSPAKETVSTTTLVAPSTSSSVSKYVLPVIQAPPELKLSEGEVEAEKELIRQGALARGDIKQQQGPSQVWDEEDYHDGDEGYEEEGGWAGKRSGQQQQRQQQADEDEDVNGFRFSEAGARANKKRKYKRKRGNSPSGPLPTNWDADYDPRIPNDYMAWKEVHRQRREAIKRIHRQQSGFQRSREVDDDEEEAVYSDSRFAPPQSGPHEQDEEEKMYLSPPPPTASELPQPLLPPPPPPPGPPPSAPNLTMSGEEAYQRRLAMSRQMQSESGEEAYQRRLAMSQQQQSIQPATTQHQSPPSQPASHENTPALAPAAAPRDLEASRNAAAAIAARLARNSSTSTSTAPSTDDDDDEEHRPDPAAFAERLMAKWGHTRGQGLGAEGNQGRADALIMEKVPQKPHRGGHDSSSTASRGKFTTADPRVQEDLEKYGSPSEVIYLGNILSADDEEDDDDLPEDIAEECNKFGIVQRVALHPASRGCFVRFSGPAGAWKAVRELNGRFFAGSKIEASYYDRGRFERGDLDGVL